MSWIIVIGAVVLIAISVICVACFAAHVDDRRQQARDHQFRTRASHNPKFLQLKHNPRQK